MSHSAPVTIVLGGEALELLVNHYGTEFVLEMRRAALNSATKAKVKGLLTHHDQQIIQNIANEIMREYVYKKNSWDKIKVGPEIREIVEEAVKEKIRQVVSEEYAKQMGDIQAMVATHVEAIEKSLRAENRLARKLITKSVLDEVAKKLESDG